MRADASRIANASFGRALNAKVSYLERLEARKIKDPFVELRQPEIELPLISKCELTDEINEPADVLTVNDYTISFEDTLLENISFTLKENEKVAIVGANGTGKTTLLRDIFQNNRDSISLATDVEIGFLSQIHGEMLNEKHTVYEEMEEIGDGFDTGVPFENRKEIEEYLAKYCFDEEMLSNKIDVLSGGEKNLLQLAKIGRSHARLLLLDEPTSHLDTYAQLALEKAIAEYQGAVLMVSHDFYTIVNCADYILFVEDKGIRKMRTRSFRKMIYEDHFKMEYLELEQKKKELEQRIEGYLLKHDFESARSVCEQLEDVIGRMKSKV
jgi:ATP-binding cassette subfamily F protein 3